MNEEVSGLLAMAKMGFHRLRESFALVLVVSVWAVLTSPALSATCSSQTFTNNAVYKNCVDLPVLTSYLHWNYDKSNSSLSIAFVAPPAKSGGWIAWAINPTGTGMKGSQTLLAVKDSSSGSMTVKTYNISSYALTADSKLSFEVWDLAAEYSESDGVMRLFGKLKVPENKETVNQVWQVGPSVTAGFPDKHELQASNFKAIGTLNLTGGQVVATDTGGDSKIKKKNIHGVLNVVSWGILFPIGAIIARYLRTFESADPVWFYLHVFCQISAYAIGVAGWGTGIKLGSESKGITFTAHRSIGIALFSIATLQVFALFLRPKKDHKYRFYWNIYHHGIGYSILVLGILNVFKGFDILDPAKKWKSAYIIVIAVLGVIALLLEAITWIVVLRRKSSKSTKPYDGYNNGQDRQ